MAKPSLEQAFAKQIEEINQGLGRRLFFFADGAELSRVNRLNLYSTVSIEDLVGRYEVEQMPEGKTSIPRLKYIEKHSAQT